MIGSHGRNHEKFTARHLSPIPEENYEKVNARIRVIVRVRPLNSKEVARGHKSIIHGLEGSKQQSMTIWDPACLDSSLHPELARMDSSCWTRCFTFDQILWSDSKNSSYASQETVFEEVGKPVVEWALGGYNCCVFAYGQTGTGKTFTMSNTSERSNPGDYGLVPRICFALFEDIDSGGMDGSESTVTFSHMEIYNETVRDLLVSPGMNSNHLRIREHPQQGVFVSNLTTVKVNNFEDVMSLIAVGDKNRTVAATNANIHSSRSHAVVTLTVVQRRRSTPRNGIPTSALQQKIGRVNLVDLAGSERVTLSGAKGSRLKEANHINLSLSVLGEVIKNLGEHGGRGHIPYRNSALTMVLKESLGGNSYAVMVTTVSPSSHDYEETLSTLKYADRAKRVRMRVEANITSGLLATDRSAVELVPLLQAEVRKLREMLQNQQMQKLQQQSLVVGLGPPMVSVNGGFIGDHTLGTAGSTVPLAHQHEGPVDVSSNASQQQQQVSSTSDVLQEMTDRVRELELQLAERERLIESLEAMRADASVGQSLHSRGEDVGDDGFRGTSGITGALQRGIEVERTMGMEPGGCALSIDGSSSSLDDASQSFSFLKRRSLADNITITNCGSVDSTSSSLTDASGLLQSQGDGPLHGRVIAVTRDSPPRTKFHSHPVVVLADDAVDVSLPRMVNLNQDPLFSECLVYYLPDCSVVAGSKEAQADILLTGPDIVSRHCVIAQAGGIVSVHPLPGALVFVNGDLIAPSSDVQSPSRPFIAPPTDRTARNVETVSKIAGVRQLNHFDRIAFGRFHLFRFEACEQSGLGASGSGGDRKRVGDVNHRPAPPPGWEFAQEELLRKNNALMSLRSANQTDAEPLSVLTKPQSQPSSSLLSPLDDKERHNDKASDRYKISRDTKSLVTLQEAMALKDQWGQTEAPHRQRSTSPDSDNGRIGITFPKRSVSPSGLASSDRVGPLSDEKENEWWDRLSRVAKGKEAAAPDELRALLQTVVARAEGDRVDERGRERDVGRKNELGAHGGVSAGLQVGSNLHRTSWPREKISLDEGVAEYSTRGTDTSMELSRAGQIAVLDAPATSTTFEREAKALQDELAQMQKTLEDRMRRYQILTSAIPSTPTNN